MESWRGSDSRAESAPRSRPESRFRQFVQRPLNRRDVGGGGHGHVRTRRGGDDVVDEGGGVVASVGHGHGPAGSGAASADSHPDLHSPSRSRSRSRRKRRSRAPGIRDGREPEGDDDVVGLRIGSVGRTVVVRIRDGSCERDGPGRRLVGRGPGLRSRAASSCRGQSFRTSRFRVPMNSSIHPPCVVSTQPDIRRVPASVTRVPSRG